MKSGNLNFLETSGPLQACDGTALPLPFTSRSMFAVPIMAVFCSSLTSCFPGMLLTYFLIDFEIVPVAPIITGITSVFTFHMRCISIVRSLYFRILSASFSITFLSPEITTSINIYVPFSLPRNITFSLLLGIVLSVCTCWFHNMVTLLPWIVSTDFCTRSYQCFLSNCTPVSLHMFIIIIVQNQRTSLLQNFNLLVSYILRDFRLPPRSVLFWVITKREVVVSYQHFGITYRSHYQGSIILETWGWDL